MGYTFNCDGPCGERYDTAPPFMGEFRESWLKTTPSVLVHAFNPGQTVTLCRDCSELFFASGKIVVCQRCGHADHAHDYPTGQETCPQCDEDTLVFRPAGDQ